MEFSDIYVLIIGFRQKCIATGFIPDNDQIMDFCQNLIENQNTKMSSKQVNELLSKILMAEEKGDVIINSMIDEAKKEMDNMSEKDLTNPMSGEEQEEKPKVFKSKNIKIC